MRKVEAPKFLEPWRIIVTLTSEIAYEMDRFILAHAGKEWEDEYMVIEGYHCSCYGFDEAAWNAVVYSRDELTKLAKENSQHSYIYGCEPEFWKLVAKALCLNLGIADTKEE